eukprot:TRINITY_DN2514_c0_g2_i1.p1 TRINITY_DN2514_c0_g2~~TRINITY_DN2514_c0_g2_i1.p1  ORF type:complete len:954 (+),score=250.24 TRINITY_DN2514_c0_g2_i1:65-2926(+)
MCIRDRYMGWSNEDWEESQVQVKKKQDELVDQKLVPIYCDLIASSSKLVPKLLKEEAILGCVSLLLGGNSKAQGAFLEYMIDDERNDFLVSLKRLMDESFTIVKKGMRYLSQKYVDIIIDGGFSPSPEGAGDSMGGSSMTISFNQSGPVPTSIEEAIKRETVNDSIKAELEFSRRLYRFLQLLCEGHNEGLQNHLREQRQGGKLNGKSQNFIITAVSTLSNTIKFLNVQCLDFCEQVMNFLIESLQGPCQGNQRDMALNRIVDIAKDLLGLFDKKTEFMKRGLIEEEDKAKARKLANMCGKLMVSLIEGNTSEAEVLSKNLDFNYLKEKLKDNLADYLAELRLHNMAPLDDIHERLPADFPEEFLESFNLFILMKTLADSSEYAKSEFESKEFMTAELGHALEFYQSYTASIEIKFKDQLIRVFFTIHPACYFLSEATKEVFMKEVNRGTPNEKLEGLVEELPALIDEMEHNYFLRSLPMSLTPNRLKLVRFIASFIAALINLLIIFSFDRKTLDPTGTYSIGIDKKIRIGDNIINVGSIIDVLGIIQIAVCSIMMVLWFIVAWPPILRQGWRTITEEYTLRRKQLDEELPKDVNVRELCVSETRELLYCYGPYHRHFHDRHGKRHFGNWETRVEFWWTSVTILVSNGSFLFYLLYNVFSWLSFLVDEMFYCFQVLDIMSRFPAMNNLLHVIKTNKNAIIMVFVFDGIMAYIYATMGFNFISDYYFSSSVTQFNDSGESLCTDLLQCFINTWNMGLRAGGGMGEFLNGGASYYDGNGARFTYRFFNDLSFYLFLNVIMTEVILGIIVDSFGQLREEKNAMQDDMTNTCFICSLHRSEFARVSDGFEPHIERDHNPWNYVYFLYALEKKDETEYNGVESEIMAKYNEGDTSWFPMLRALSIPIEEKLDLEQIIEEGTKRLMDELRILAAKIQKFELALSKFVRLATPAAQQVKK